MPQAARRGAAKSPLPRGNRPDFSFEAPGLLAEVLVDFLHQRLRVHPVNGASLLQGFAPGGGTAQAVHAHLQEVGRGGLVQVQNLANDGIFGNARHVDDPPNSGKKPFSFIIIPFGLVCNTRAEKIFAGPACFARVSR